MDSVQKTDLTTDTSVGRTEVDTVDAGDFFEIAKPAEDFKISATNLANGIHNLLPIWLRGVPTFTADYNHPFISKTNEAWTETIPLANLHACRGSITGEVIANDGASYSSFVQIDIQSYPDDYIYLDFSYSLKVSHTEPAGFSGTAFTLKIGYEQFAEAHLALNTTDSTEIKTLTKGQIKGWYFVNKALNRIEKL